ncbi:MAG: hypothetical protein AAF851_09270 [Myxococcota bacterium]
MQIHPSCFIYVISRDFGFAPNPFHGYCTLSACKPVIRRTAKIGDWVVGMGGSRLRAVGRCIFCMQVDETLTFDDYWEDPRFRSKRPVRNGSDVMLVGDNIYHSERGHWTQEDSHHSLPDGSANSRNVQRDTSADRVLVSSHFRYFGKASIEIPSSLLRDLNFRNCRSYRRYPLARCQLLLNFLCSNADRNVVIADPIDFSKAAHRYSGEGAKMLRPTEQSFSTGTE